MKTKAKKLTEMETKELIQTAYEAINYTLDNIKCGITPWQELYELKIVTLQKRIKELTKYI